MMKENYNTPNSGCCGRPFPTAPENKCNHNDCCMNEYAYKQKACIREKQPDCEAQAVIPSITVETVDGITNLANCLVHVTSTNTTYYVDDKHRVMITWAGPVNIPGYDMDANPNHYKNQIVTDIDAKIAVIYDNNGRGFTFAIDQNADFTKVVDEKLEEMARDGSFQPVLDETFKKYYDILEDETEQQLVNKVDKNGTGQVTYNNLSQSVKEMFTGGNTPVVGVNSVGEVNISDSSIPYQKLNSNGKNGVAGFNQRRNIITAWDQGTRHIDPDGALTPSSNTIVTAEPIPISMGMRITMNPGYKAALYSYTSGSLYFMQSGFTNFDRLIGTGFPEAHKNDAFYISVRHTDDSDITPNEGVDSFVITENQGVVKPSFLSFDNNTQKLVLGKTPVFTINDSYTIGNALQDGRVDFTYYNGPISNSMNRAFLNTPIFMPAGTVIKSTNDWQFVVVTEASRWETTKDFYPKGTGWTDDYTVQNEDVYYITYRKSDNSGIGDIADQFLSNVTISFPVSNGGDKTIFVSGTGNDETGDGSRTKPYREITRAISDGATTIMCEGGYKYAPLTYSYLSNIKIIGRMATYSSPSNVVQPKPYFDSSIELTGNVLESGKVKIPYTAEEDSDMYACLVAHTKDLKDTDSTRSDGYYCTIFSDGDKDTSHRYIPVLTADNTAGHFYYDGSYIYINPYSDNGVDNNYSLVDSAAESAHYLVNLANCQNITFENFCFKHASKRLLYMDKCTGMEVTNCDFYGSSREDNLAALNTNVKITNCVSYLARNDGYNFHGFGASVVTKCIGCHCFDDGISHHDKCNHTIIGGEYYDNGKGGIASPTYGCSSDIIGCYIHGNLNGIHTGSDTSHGESYINLNNNVITGNNTGVRLSGCTGVMYNNKVVDNNTNIVNNSSVVVYQ